LRFDWCESFSIYSNCLEGRRLQLTIAERRDTVRRLSLFHFSGDPVLLSIVTICRNNPAELGYTLASFARLDTTLVETIVVDGSDNDACERIGSGRVTQYIRGRDSGRFNAMNKGVKRAGGASVLFMNSGDRLADATSFCAVVRRHCAVLGRTILYSDYVHEFEGFSVRVNAPPLTLENLRIGKLPSHQSTLIPATFYKRHQFDESYQIYADTELNRRAFSSIPAIYIPEVIGRFAAGGISTTPGSWRLEARRYREACRALDLTKEERRKLFRNLVKRKLVLLRFGAAEIKRRQEMRFKKEFPLYDPDPTATSPAPP